MSNFRIQYLAPSMLDATGRPDPSLAGYFRHELVIAAQKPRDAMQVVMDRGGVVLQFAEVKPASGLWRLIKPSVNRSYKQKFLQAMAFNVRSGLSPEKSLEQVILGELGEPRVALNESLNALRQGFGFVQALEVLQWFDDSTLAVLRAGEAAGQLSQALETAVGFYEKGSATLRLMFGAVTWTALDLIMAVSTVIGMRFGLIEQLRKTPILSEDPTKVARYMASLNLAQHVNDGLLVLSFLFIVALLYFTLMLLSPDEKVRAQAFGILERTPVLGGLLVSAGLSATTRVLASLLQGGVTFLNAVQIARKGTLTPSVSRLWADIIARSEIGEHPSSAFSHPLLDSSERLLIRAHRDQNQLAECLLSVSETREEKANSAAKKFAVIAFIASLLYSGVAVIFSLAVVYLQNEVVLSGGG
ncbi:MAG TPA: type II secretion system F family protein [Limnobacter sp.]|uniref:type II secretion system F family protein n=1 Tax=Limnobacter sp. TaxID=2003368 RepID=UPI002ED98B9A